MMSIAGLIALSFLGPAHAEDADSPTFIYPEARRGDVVDTYHDVEVADPYRWLEAPDSEETRAWVEGQVALTTDYLSAIPAQTTLKERLEVLWNYERSLHRPRKEIATSFVTTTACKITPCSTPQTASAAQLAPSWTPTH